jgi:hypothetical protein
VVISNSGSVASSHANTLTSNTVSVTNSPDFSDGSTTYMTNDPIGDIRTGAQMRYAIMYYNTGLTEANNVKLENVIDPLFDDKTLEQISGPSGTYNSVSRTLSWNLGTIGPGLGGRVEYKAGI